MSKWISVDARLPDLAINVLICLTNDAIFTGWIGYYGEWRVVPADPVCTGNPVTHWMPLPRPPERNPSL